MDKKILIVDDEPNVLELLEERLSHAGYSVLKAETGEDAIDLATEKRPDLILLDILMPGLDGAETAEILKSNPKTKNIPIVFLTCLLKKSEEESKHIRGGKYFIAKPYDPDELLEIVKKYAS